MTDPLDISHPHDPEESMSDAYDVDPDRSCGGCGLELSDEELKGDSCPRCNQEWPTPEKWPEA